VTRPFDSGPPAKGYPQWFQGVTDQAGNPLPVFCPRCGAQLTVIGCAVPPFTGFLIQTHRCRP